MKEIRPWLRGAGLSMLYLLPPITEFLSPNRLNFYHQLLPITTLMRGIFIDVLLLGVLGGIFFLVIDRSRTRVRDLLWLPVFCVLSWVAARDLSGVLATHAIRAQLLRLTPYIPGVILILGAGLLIFAPRGYAYCIRGVRVLLESGGLALVFVILPQLAWSSFNTTPREQASFDRPVSEQWQPGQTRIVWILFDELSYRQAFEHPQPGIELPSFTALAKQSVTFSQLRPVGYETERIIPSLLLNQTVEDVKADIAGNLLLRKAVDAPWQPFDQNATIFALAKQHGWGTGVAGWYNPYCRILNSVLNRCYWTFGQPVSTEIFSGFSSRKSSWQNARDGLPLAAHLELLWRHQQSNQVLINDYWNILHVGEALIQDSDIRFALIHMPVPHPPGLYPDPTVAGGKTLDYLGNLVLADRAMGHFLSRLANSPDAANTVVIVSSDHSWRVPLWRRELGWTKAEEHATDGGHFDQRPVLMVRFPGEMKPEQIDRPLSEDIVHGLVQNLIEGKIRTSSDWIATLPSSASAMTRMEPEAD